MFFIHEVLFFFYLPFVCPFLIAVFYSFWQVMVNSEKDRASLLCMKALANRGRLDSVSQQMASHPQYLESFLRTQHYILYMDGPLPLHYRHYIAIMVRTERTCLNKLYSQSQAQIISQCN